MNEIFFDLVGLLFRDLGIGEPEEKLMKKSGTFQEVNIRATKQKES